MRKSEQIEALECKLQLAQAKNETLALELDQERQLHAGTGEQWAEDIRGRRTEHEARLTELRTGWEETLANIDREHERQMTEAADEISELRRERDLFKVRFELERSCLIRENHRIKLDFDGQTYSIPALDVLLERTDKTRAKPEMWTMYDGRNDDFVTTNEWAHIQVLLEDRQRDRLIQALPRPEVNENQEALEF